MVKQFKSNPAILNEARDYLDGLLLSDGSIPCSRDNAKTNNYSQSCKYKEWLDKISKDLYRYFIESRVNDGILRIKRNLIEYSLWTCKYIEFKEMDNRWYKRWYDLDDYPKTRWHTDEHGDIYIRKKIVPKDICLSPECVVNWYLGDGSCYKYLHQSGYNITFATYGFLRDDIMFISKLLSKILDIKTTVTKENVIKIGIQSDISKFFDYIKDCEIPYCYSYKFPDLSYISKENLPNIFVKRKQKKY